MRSRISQPSIAGTRSRRGGVAAVALWSLAGLTVLGVGGYLAISAGSAPASAPGGADVVPASIGSFSITTLAVGELKARQQTEIRSQIEESSSVVEIVPEGSRVKRGDLLVRLNTEALEDEIVEEELELSQTELDYLAASTDVEIQKSENESRLRAAKLQVELAELALKEFVGQDAAFDTGEDGSYKTQLRQLELALERAGREHDRLQEKYQNSIVLETEEFISKDELKRDELEAMAAAAALEQARMDLESYKRYESQRTLRQLQSDLEEAQAELARTEQENQVQLAQQRSRMENRRERLNRQREHLAELNEQLEASTIYAPTDGLVVYATSIDRDSWSSQTRGPIEIGREISPNDLIIVLPDTSEMLAEVKVHESLVGSVRPGQRATVAIDAAGAVVNGEVRSVGVLAEGGGWRDPNRREYTVRIAMSPPPEVLAELKPAMRCEAELELGRVDETLNVPTQAVFNDGEIHYVYSPRGDRFERVPVRIGRRSDLRAEVLAGLDEGARVLIRRPETGEVAGGPFDPELLEAAGYNPSEAPVGGPEEDEDEVEVAAG